jgi:hypothetical protein
MNGDTGLDWGGFGIESISRAEVAEIVAAFPRLKMKHKFAEACRHFVPGYKSTSTVDLLINAPFTE